jgi:hypothetical protein
MSCIGLSAHAWVQARRHFRRPSAVWRARKNGRNIFDTHPQNLLSSRFVDHGGPESGGPGRVLQRDDIWLEAFFK